MPTLARAYVDYEIDLLQVIASQWDLDLQSTDRLAIVDELAGALARPEAVAGIWEWLSDDEQVALTDLIIHEGEIPFAQFCRVHGEIRPMGPARREREKPWLQPISPTEGLYYKGLLIRVFEQTPAGAQEFAAIPDDLLAILPRPIQTEAPQAPGYPVAPPRNLKDGHATAPDDMATILSYLLIREENARLWLTRQPVEIIDHYLRRPDTPAYRALLVQLAYDLGMLVDEQVLTHVVTRVEREVARPWLEAPRTHQIRSLVVAWRASTSWNDLAYTPGLEAEQWPNNPLAAREAILDMLNGVPAEIWWGLDGFIEYVERNNPDFQRPSGDYSAWYLSDAYTGEILHGFQYWRYIEGALLRFIIEGPMRWLGLTHAGRGAFLLTPFGLALQGRAPWPVSPDREVRVRVDQQGLVSVPVDISRYDRLQIARFSAWVSAPGPAAFTTARESRDEGVYVYRLTPQAIGRVAEEGISIPSHIIPFLQRLSGHSLPANVLKMLQAWHDEPREVLVLDVVVLTARDLGVYERLRANERINRWLGQQIGPHSHIVRREHMPALLNALREMGILPLFEGHEKDNWPL
jgi:hypothetical protein